MQHHLSPAMRAANLSTCNLRRIFMDLRDLLESGSNRRPSSDAWDLAEEYLKERGFKYLASGVFSSAYSHKAFGGVVIKISQSGCNVPNLKTFPFLKTFWVKPLFCSAFVVIQPLADTSRKREAHEEIHEQLEKISHPNHRRYRKYDMHENNVGYYKGRAVSFDIMADSD